MRLSDKVARLAEVGKPLSICPLQMGNNYDVIAEVVVGIHLRHKQPLLEAPKCVIFPCNHQLTMGIFLLPQPSDDDTVSLHSQVSETARADALSLLSKMDSCKGHRK